MTTARPRQRPPRLSEDDFQERVLGAARLYGWRAVHVRPLINRSGKWSTAYRGDGGLPDLILAKDGRVLLAELKSDVGKPTEAQLAWLAAAGPNGYLWRPKDWDGVLAVLRDSTP